MEELRNFLYNSVYDISRVHLDFRRSAKVVRELFEVFMSNDQIYGQEIGRVPSTEPERARAVCDFVAGMTDRYALDLYHRIFLPRPWAVL
jgi:dGTPase